MKLRTSFVSNSSSSSFIVAFNKGIKTFDQLKKYMFPNDNLEDDAAPDCDWYDEKLTVERAVQIVLKDLKKAKKATKKQILEELTGLGDNQGDYKEIFDLEKEHETATRIFESQNCLQSIYSETNDKKVIKKRKEFFKKWDKKFNEAYMKLAKKVYKEKFEKLFEDKNVFILSYSDNGNGVERAIMEHGNIFRNIPHVRISNH